uniref:Uncharacterized protein n=1 Tax=Gasterosteus aculeatus TaxID=69293 RepID=G3NCC4_GASAC
MDCSTDDVAHDSPGNNGSCSDDDVPFSKLMNKPRREEKPSRGNGHRSSSNSAKDKSASPVEASDDSSDDKPLIKKKIVSAPPAKKIEKKGNKSIRSNGTNDKADTNSDDGSDNEALKTIPKKSSKAAKNSISKASKKSVPSKKKELLEDDKSSGDEHSIEPRKKSYPKRKASCTPPRKVAPVVKSKRNLGREKVKYAESSTDGSDNEPLSTLMRKKAQAPKGQTTSPNSKKTKPTDKSPKGMLH